MGPWDLGGWYRPLAVVSTAGCIGLIVDWNAAAQ